MKNQLLPLCLVLSLCSRDCWRTRLSTLRTERPTRDSFVSTSCGSLEPKRWARKRSGSVITSRRSPSSKGTWSEMPACLLRRTGIVSFEPASPANHTWSTAELRFTWEAEGSRRQTPPPDGPDLCQRCGRSGNAAQRKSGSIPPPAPPLRS
jgi:hypothetical protein